MHKSSLTTIFVDDYLRIFHNMKLLKIGLLLSFTLLISNIVVAQENLQNVIWSHSGDRLISIGKTAQVWSGDQLDFELAHTPGFPVGASWKSDDSQIMTFAQDNMARLWDAQTGALLMALQHENPSTIMGAHWNRDNSLILTWDEVAARVWDANTGALIHELYHEDQPMLGATWNAAGNQALTWTADGSISLWQIDIHQVETIAHFPALGGTQIGGVAWSPDEQHMMVWADSAPTCTTCPIFAEIHIWDVESQRLVHSLTHEQPLKMAVWHPDSQRILAIPVKQPPRLWDSHNGVELFRMTDAAIDVTWLANGRMASLLLENGSLQVWDMNRIELVWQRQFDTPLRGIDWASDLGAAYTENTVYLLNQAGDTLLTYATDRPVSQAQFNTDHTQLATWSFDEAEIKLWQVPHILEAPDGVRRAHWSPDGAQVALWSGNPGQEDSVQIWDVKNGVLETELSYAISAVSDGRWNHDGTQFLTWSWDNTARTWDTITGHELAQFHHRHRTPSDIPIQVYGAIWNRAESHVLTWASHSNSAAAVWDATNGNRVYLLPHGRENAVLGASWNQDETQILTWGTNGTARLWNALTGQLIHEFRVEGALVYDAQWNRDESAILTRVNTASFCFDQECEPYHRLYVWNTTTGDLIRTFDHSGLVEAAFWLDNRHVLSQPQDKSPVYIWDMRTSAVKFRLGEAPINAVALSPITPFCSRSVDGGLIQVWNHREDEGAPVFSEIRWHPDGQLVAVYHHYSDEAQIIDHEQVRLSCSRIRLMVA